MDTKTVRKQPQVLSFISFLNLIIFPISQKFTYVVPLIPPNGPSIYVYPIYIQHIMST